MSKGIKSSPEKVCVNFREVKYREGRLIRIDESLSATSCVGFCMIEETKSHLPHVRSLLLSRAKRRRCWFKFTVLFVRRKNVGFLFFSLSGG